LPIAIITESVGVPLHDQRRSSCWRMRTGRERVSEWPAPDCSSAGGADPDIVAKLACDRFQNRHAGGVIAVVVGEEDAHVSGLSLFVTPGVTMV